jgi:hypothetical protein
VIRLILGLGLVGWLAGCDRPNFDTPVDAYLSFTKAVKKSDFKTAFGALSSQSRALVTERAKATSEASGGGLSSDPAAWFFARGGRVDPVDKVELVQATGEEATVRAFSAGGTQELRLRRESGAWKVDVTPLLEGPKTP